MDKTVSIIAIVTIILASFLFSGCYASQRDLTRVRTDLRAEMRHAANSRALAVHECALTRDYAVRAALFCLEARGHELQAGACNVSDLWRLYCLRTLLGDRILTNPRPGVNAAINRAITAFEEHQTTGTVVEHPAILEAGEVVVDTLRGP